MKKSIFLLIFIVFLAIDSHAQRFMGGLMGGLNATQVRGDSYGGYNKAGVLVGAFVGRELKNDFFWQMEFKYSQKGSRKNPDHKKEEYDKYLMRLGYMELPVILGYHIDDQFDVLAGISAGWLAHSSEETIDGKLEKPDQVAFNEYEFAGFAGLKYHLSDRLSVDLRIGYSILPMRDLKGGSDIYNFTGGQFNNVLSTALYYTFK